MDLAGIRPDTATLLRRHRLALAPDGDDRVIVCTAVTDPAGTAVGHVQSSPGGPPYLAHVPGHPIRDQFFTLNDAVLAVLAHTVTP